MTATVTTPRTTGLDASTPATSFARHRTGVVLVGALALLVLGAFLIGGGTWPESLTVDLTGPLGGVSDWIIDNRDTHPLFLYFFGHISNAVVLSVRGVYLVPARHAAGPVSRPPPV